MHPLRGARRLIFLVTRFEESCLPIHPFKPQTLLFARNFFKHPRMLGSFIPSSRFVVGHLLDQVDWRRARVIVEYGPGVGNISRELLGRMRPDARLVLIELNSDFVAYLRGHFTDPRVTVVNGSAADVAQALAACGLERADYIISGIPYSTMPHALRHRILRESRNVLHPAGAFLVYQFTRTVLPHLTRLFPRVHQQFEPRNILPARLFYCRV